MAKSARKPAPQQATPGQRFDNPWLRTITLAESVQYSRVTVYGDFDPRGVQMLMEKPSASLAMTFREDPYDGLAAQSFQGPAVSFLPTVPFMARQASLR